MDDQTPSLTTAQHEKVLKSLGAMKTNQVGEHLTPDEAANYAQGAMSPEDSERVEQHLESCPACAVQIENLLEALAFWSSPEGEQHMDAIRQRLVGESP